MKECEDLKKCREAVTDRLTNIEEAQAELRDVQVEQAVCINDINKKLDGMTELLTINKNVKGFVNTAGVIGKLLVWVTLTGGAITAIWKYVTHIGQP